jgi:hypothetical protein
MVVLTVDWASAVWWLQDIGKNKTNNNETENNEGDDHDEIDDDLLGDTSAAWKMHPRRMEFNPRHKKSET